MNKLIKIAGILAVSAGVLASQPAKAETFRFAFQGDVASMDPYALAENFSSAFHSNIHEPLVRYNSNLQLEPGLAVSWENISPKTWRFKLREGVKFHNGNSFDADDVVFSIKRAQAEGADMGSFVGGIADVVEVDARTVDIITEAVNPIMLNTIAPLAMMDKQWAEEHDAVSPVNISEGVENYSTLHANGTGPFKLVSREPGVKTVLTLNKDWWDMANQNFNVTDVVMTPIGSDATRTAALLSGELDLMFPAPVQDVDRINSSGVATVLQGPELRTIFLGMDQERDELLYSNIKGKNPLKNKKVRTALYHAIDIEAIKSKVMRGASTPAGLLLAPNLGGFNESLNGRLPYDPELSRALLNDAGYPDGFEIQLDCPNNRYVNDEQICQVVAGMFAKVGVKVNLLAQPKSKFFAKLKEHDISMYLLGWIPDDQDAGSVIAHLMVPPADGGLAWNGGKYGNDRVTELSRMITSEVDQTKRQAMIDEAFGLVQSDVGYIPLHQQALSWGVRNGVTVAQRSDNALQFWYINIK
ncbi:MAG: ABC transporter substrate-binding protein [Alphaproteobacteria bacterium]|nr:ABC transporter substrate-binding protein [Alphaproteobacteria bacterium]